MAFFSFSSTGEDFLRSDDISPLYASLIISSSPYNTIKEFSGASFSLLQRQLHNWNFELFGKKEINYSYLQDNKIIQDVPFVLDELTYVEGMVLYTDVDWISFIISEYPFALNKNDTMNFSINLFCSDRKKYIKDLLTVL